VDCERRIASPYFHDIIAAYKVNGRSAKETVSYLRRKHPRLPTETVGRFDSLAESTLREWFDADGELLSKHQRSIDADGLILARGVGTSNRALDAHPAVEDEAKRLLSIMRHDTGAVVNLRIIRWVMRAVMQRMEPSLLDQLSLSSAFLSRWAKTQMGWSWRVKTGAASKLPLGWEQQGVLMAKRIAVNMQLYEVRRQHTVMLAAHSRNPDFDCELEDAA